MNDDQWEEMKRNMESRNEKIMFLVELWYDENESMTYEQYSALLKIYAMGVKDGELGIYSKENGGTDTEG